MGNWRSDILTEFTPNVSRLTLVADPDSLLLEEGIHDGIRERGFEIISFEDYVAFRYSYESKYRSHWDRGESTGLVVALRLSSGDLNSLPYDLLQIGRRLSFNLGDLFPGLSSPVVAALDRAYFDDLYEAQEHYTPGQLGENATKDFILRHVFEFAPELIKRPSDLLRVLMSRHYRGMQVPPDLDKRFVQVLRQNPMFRDWPLEAIVPDRVSFFAFLQERWPIYLDSLFDVENNSVHEGTSTMPLEFGGPALLPFDHDDIRVYIDNLFLEGVLQPVFHDNINKLADNWAICGVNTSQEADCSRRVNGLLNSIEKTLPGAEVRYREWLRFAVRWAELVALEAGQATDLQKEQQDRMDSLRDRVNSIFLAWVFKRYATLTNLPPVPPVMVHHIPRFLARRLEGNGNPKIAFLLLDGLSLDQWVRLRDVLEGQEPNFRFKGDPVFAWIPTITSVSRQAVFAGKLPMYFPTSIHTTDKEPGLWSQFWADQGLNSHEVAYARGLGDIDKLDDVSELLTRPGLRALGLVIDKVDKIMHGMELGTAGMHNQIRQWGTQGFMLKLLNLLFENGFQVFLSSDHGNVEAKGIGRPAEGSVADLRGERVRVYSDPILRAHVKDRFPDSIEWPAVGLPEKYYPLIAPSHSAFVSKGKKIVSHGGISIEELIVPFVCVERRKA